MGTCGTAALDVFVRGVGRTGVPAPVIQDFLRAPPKTAFKVAFDDTTSRSETAWPSLSGGLRMS